MESNLEPKLNEEINTQKLQKKLKNLESMLQNETVQLVNIESKNNLAAQNNEACSFDPNQKRNPKNLGIDLTISSTGLQKPTLSLQKLNKDQLDNKSKFNKLEAVNEDKYNVIKENAGYLLIDGERVKTKMNDLIEICELGSGTCGVVMKMQHRQTGKFIAVKQMRISGIAEENKRIIMDLDVIMKCGNCNNIVTCLGYFISDTDVWICMELMTMCFDKLLKLIKKPIPEKILGKLTICTLNALNFLKQKHNVIHRDIKPSNLLINLNGEIKLCDFGISGNLVDSRVQTRNAGCAGYMAPERIELTSSNYDIRADVWSLGITLVELATGLYPFSRCTSDFEVMTAILKEDPPKLEGPQFSQNFKEFVRQCLIKDEKKRPKYDILLQNPFVLQSKNESVDVKSWFLNILEEHNKLG